MPATVDVALARRLERAEAMANAASVESRRALQPESGACWIEVAGVYAMYDSPTSPITQTFGLGLFDPFLDREFDEVETFFDARHAPTSHEVSSFAAPATLSCLAARGYTPIEASTVLIRPTSIASASDPGAITVRPVRDDEIPLWSRTAAQGWATDIPELSEFLENLGTAMARARGVTCFIGELDGRPVATAALNIANDTALLAGAATIPDARRRGAQRALLQARLAFAAEHGIDLAMVVTQPASTSQRNAERQGFRPVYTRAKWQRATVGSG